MSDAIKSEYAARMTKRTTRFSIATLMVLFAASVYSEDGTDRKLQGDLRKMEAVEKEGESWEALEKANSRDRMRACEAALGSANFCACLNERLNWVIGFETYVHVISAPDARPNPGATDSEGIAMNSIFTAREQCVGEY